MAELAPPGVSTRRSPLERRLLGGIDPERIRAELAALGRTPSLTGHEEAAAALAAGLLADAGADVRVVHDPDPTDILTDPAYPGSEVERSSLPVVIGTLGRPGRRRLVLNGHLDVVPAGDPATWTTDPWGAEVRDGRLYGRGACDMKGGVASILAAVRALAPHAGSFDGELVVSLVPSEEDGGSGTLSAIRNGAVGDMAVVPEPTRLQLIVAHAGAITFRLEVPGRAAHASMRREGVSALDGLQVLLHALEADEAVRNGAETDPLMSALGLPYPTIVGKIAGGEWASTVLDRVVAEGRYGVRLGQSPAEAEAELRACIEAASERDPWLRDHPARVEVTGGRFGSARADPNGELSLGLAAAARDVLGREPARVGVPYGADMRLLIDEGRTPTVMFGPGDVAVAHSADEHVPLDEVVECARVLAVWASRELHRG
ncbi:MAG TPA: ArgE/DapE family deacylase [Candidatus Dormibacteraeota bacterium]|nr:ArgE/DapE family deacylase [Candidatus Dormibacteraeota bacterium]